MSSLPIVLIFTYAEYGQANVNLATAYELALAGVDVYIASFASLGTRVSQLQDLVQRHAPRSGGKPAGSVVFHECKGIPPFEAILRRGVKSLNFSHSHGVSGALKSYSNIDVVVLPWSQEEYRAGIEDCKEIIASIKPNVVLTELYFTYAQDACKLAGQRFLVISPMSIKELAVDLQPYWAAFWKYPAPSSGFPFPLKWWQIPINAFLNARFITHMSTSRQIKQIGVLRESLGLKSMFGVLGNQFYPGITNICSTLVEIDFPYAVIPEGILLCGPIVMPFDPLEESDTALMKWLDNCPTVMVNLGSLLVSDEEVTKETASAFRILLDRHDQEGNKIQVLWKVKMSGEIQPVIDGIIGKEIKEERVKVLPWLDVEPVSILQHPNVVCTVHHGGANSFYEGVWSGVPHVILAVWYDTYDYASRVEFLNIGIFGNRTCAPSVRAEEFGKALVRVTGETAEAANFRRSAKDLKEVCRTRGNGRELCSTAILKEAGIGR